MKFISILLFCLFSITFTIAQTANFTTRKPIIDTGAIGSWPSVNGDVIMSNDGKYVAFTINNQPIGSTSLIVQDIDEKWKRVFILESGIECNFLFSTDSKKLCLKKGDSLFLLDLRQSSPTFIGLVSRYIFPRIRKGAWIAYSLTEDHDRLILLNLVTGSKYFFPHVSDAFFDDNSELLVLDKLEKEHTLQVFNLQKSETKVIFNCDQSGKLISYQFDETSKQFAFIIQESQNKTVFYYKNGMAEAIKKIDQKDSILNTLTISQIEGFDRNGKWLILKLQKNLPAELKLNSDLASVDVWSYRDLILNPRQLYRSNLSIKTNTVDLAIEVSSNDLKLLNNDGLIVKGLPFGDHVIVSSDTAYEREYWWPYSSPPCDWLLSLKDGSKKFLLSGRSMLTNESSPDGRWIFWWDGEKNSWSSYEIANGATGNITANIPVNFNSRAQYHASIFNVPVAGIAGWYRHDAFLLIYDNYDIWKVDPANKIPPVNITGGYGSKNKIELRIVYERDSNGNPMIYNGNETLLIVGYNQETKFNGFFRITLNKPGKLEFLSMRPFTWYRHPSQARGAGIIPLKGGEGLNTGYVLIGESATEYPNYYYTRNFKTFHQLTNLEPQRKYNWLTTELVTWNLPNGRTSQGVLYKPENFDSSKKYPIIFNYYEKKSFELFTFASPGLAYDDINIPWFVSRGYLVFCPDIYYEVGAKTGISSGKYACMAVESSAKELVKRYYIDSNKMAIDGHSFGGLETNYILTHSRLFAAAAEGAGFTDEMSTYLTLSGDGSIYPLDIESVQSPKEQGHAMYGTTPWSNPNLYLDNSAVWSANNVSTPLLSFHNKKDDQVHWWQGVELYMALRRLSKPCWLLQYDDGRHILTNEKDALDYTIRLTEFFDHYLKDKYPPRWMTQGVPAKLKQVETRYDLDTTYGCWKDCKVCNKLGLSNDLNF